MGCVRSRTRSRRRSVYAYADEHQYVKNQAVGSQAVWSSGTGGGATRSRSRPSMHKTQGVLSTIQILPSELPSVQAGRSPPLFASSNRR